MCLLFVGVVGKYPQSVITGDSCVPFLIRCDCITLEINVFSALDMSEWDVGVELLGNEFTFETKKRFNETTRGWDLKINLGNIPQTGKLRRVVVYAKKPERDNVE